jgi:nitrite reductase (NADH) small subunit
MSHWKTVCRVDDIPALGSRRVTRPQGLAVARVPHRRRQVFALLDRCPHKGGPLSQGIVFGERGLPAAQLDHRPADGCAKAPDEGCTPHLSPAGASTATCLDADRAGNPGCIDLPAPVAGPCSGAIHAA